MYSRNNEDRKSERVSWKRDVTGLESDYGNQELLSQEFSNFSDNPELCDVMFVVGMDKIPMYGVKAILAARSKVFLQMIYSEMIADKPDPNKTVIFNKLQPIRRSVKKKFESHRHQNNESTARRQVGIRKIDANVIQVDDFEPDVFKQLLEFLHTGSVMLQPRTMLGLLNAADHFGIDDLKGACMQFCDKCIRVETVCALLLTAERYIQYKSTKIFVQKMLDYIALNAEHVLRLNDVVHLPRHVMELILAREDLKATAISRYYATERWVLHQNTMHRNHQPSVKSSTLMQPFLPYIAFHEIATEVLMRHIRPQGIIPDTLLMNALVLAADSEPPEAKPADRRLTPQPVSKIKNRRASSIQNGRAQSCTHITAQFPKQHICNNGSSDSSAVPKSSNGSYMGDNSISSHTSGACSPIGIKHDHGDHKERVDNLVNELNGTGSYVNMDEARFGTVIMIDDDQELLLNNNKYKDNYQHLKDCYSRTSASNYTQYD